MEEYIVWDNQSPGITFCENSGKITIFKKTLEAIGYPAYYRFLFDPDKNSFAVQSCEMEAEGAHKLPKLTRKGCCEISSLALVRFVYRNCRWNRRISYRIPGEAVAGKDLIQFDLNAALEIHEGRLTEQKQN